ncbi:uncharacterized protein LOC132085291 [Ammospiza nelsoni]|uniref:uncharacterized protein LOC132085291 n=1 Tax=Ammospiza nelsoni TaxID=2857394 RepID=UPI00286D017B|nr:uncharacterized protein LOC132085291 [Ammospiza nelsoni]
MGIGMGAQLSSFSAIEPGCSQNETENLALGYEDGFKEKPWQEQLRILTAVLLGLVLTPALADYSQQAGNNCQVSVGGVFQNLTLSSLTRVVVIEQRSNQFSWKTVWNYNTGIIATKLVQQNTCYISVMNRNEMPSFENLAHMASQNGNQMGLGRPSKKITFVTNGLVTNLSSYGIEISAMCSGLTTYMATEVHRPQVNLGSCITLDVLRIVELDYCSGNGNWNGNIPVIIGGQSQIVTINRQWRVAIIEQRSFTGSWKTIWNYNTGVIATKVTQQNACYISIMNRNEMPSFNNLARLAEESKNQFGHGRPTKKITFVTNGLVSNLRSYGSDVFSMCSGLTTYMTYEVHGFQANLGSCITLDVLGVVDLKYCTGNGNGQGSQTHVVIIGGQSQIVTINRQWRVAIIEQTSFSGSWKTIWNYNTGVIATKVTQQNACYISIMNRNEMPSFENLAHLAEESKNQFGHGRPTKKITFVTNGLVSNLRSYGSDVFSMCSGLTTYMTYEVHGFQANLGSCITLDVLGVVDLKYCTGNGNGQSQQIPGGIFNNTQGSQTHVVIIGGQSQIVTINRQWRVAIIEQTSFSGSWKTIWNYNTGVIATKVTQQNACYISIMNRNEMPSFENLAHLAEESKNQFGHGRPTKKITFVTNGLVSNLRSYGSDVFSMCSGLTTYMTYEVHGVQANLGSCITLDVLGVVDLKYCTGNGNGQGSQTHVVIIGGQSQIVTINRQWRVAIIEQTSFSGSWKTIWNYNTGVIATKVTQQNACYISIMNRNEMPSFENLAHLAEESKNQFGHGRPTKKITFVTNGLVSNLRSYGSDVFSMCSGLTTYMTYEVHGHQVNLGACITLDVLRVVDLKYCTGNGNDQQIPGGEGNSHLVIIGGQSQIVTINRQWRVAIIEKKAGIGSWKTIWNYNTGIIVTKVTQQNACYISTMNRNEMPLFDNLAHLAQESKNQFGLGRPTKKITFVTNGLVSNLRSYGSDVFSMCSGLTTYMTYEVHGHQVNLGACITLDVLRVVDLKYCTGNGNDQQIPGGEGNSHLVIIGGQSQIVTINRQWRVAIIEKKAGIGSWKTIWNYNTGIIVTKVTQQNACYISTMNRNEMPLFDNLAHLAQESKNQFGLGRPTKKITFVTNGLVSNLRSYGSDVFSMCSGLTTYMTYELHGVQVNLGSCITLDVLRVVDLKYCTGNGNDQSQQIPGGIFNNTQGNILNNTQVIIGGQSQIVTINRQWRVAIIEQRSFSRSWKTIWNYNTGIIVTKVTQQNACYISTMNRNEMPRFDNLAHLAELSRNQYLLPRPTKKITFVTNGLVSNLRSYGSDVFSMCSGLTTYMTYEVHGVQVNLGSCITLDVLGVVDLKYCTGNGNGQGSQTHVVIIGGQSQIVTINRQWRVAIIEQTSFSGSWKTIWNYNTGVIVTKVTQQNACYISTMNRNEMPRFDNLAHLAEESKNHIGFGRPTKKIIFVASALVNNLRSYGSDVFSMCSGLTTYMAYEVHGPQVNLGSCITLDVLQVVDLQYCSGNFHGNGQSQQIPGHNCHFSGACVFQNMTLSSQTHEVIFQQRSEQFSWKTIWNYNTGIIATKLVQERTCYISTMNRSEMPTFDALVRFAADNKNQVGLGRPTRKITFVTNGLVSNLNSYGADVFAMCSGLTTYMTYEVHGPQLNQGSCISLDVLKLVDLNYCGGNIKA